MAVLVTKAEGHKKKFADTEGKRFSYRTTDAGVLRVVQTEGEKQTLTQEYSPAGWLAVTGERYLSEISGSMVSADADPDAPVKPRPEG